MPAPNQARQAAVEALRDDFTTTDTRVKELEAELGTARDDRTRLNRALTAIDPTWESVDHRTGPKTHPRRKGTAPNDKWRISEERVAESIEQLRAGFDGRPFNATEAQPVIGLHITSVHKLFKKLHERGQLQLDHMGGQRMTTRYYTLPPNPEGGNDGK